MRKQSTSDSSSSPSISADSCKTSTRPIHPGRAIVLTAAFTTIGLLSIPAASGASFGVGFDNSGAPVATSTTGALQRFELIEAASPASLTGAWASFRPTTALAGQPADATTAEAIRERTEAGARASRSATRTAPGSAPSKESAKPAASTASGTRPTAPSVITGFLACVRNRESRGNYQAVNPSSGAGGAFQFLPSTWRIVVRHAGRTDLLYVLPQYASPADQDAMALDLYHWQGRSPWEGPGC